MMQPIFIAAIIFGIFAFCGWAICAINKTPKKSHVEKEGGSSFQTRRAVMQAEVQARKTEEQAYRERLAAAFEEAKRWNALIISEVEWAEVENDKYSNRRDKGKTLLTRFTPILTKELAEKIREYEVEFQYSCDVECVSQICLDARQINWQVVEVPRRYEPPNLRDDDRIIYPDLSAQWLKVPDVLTIAARQMLDYGDEYIAEQVAIREAEDAREPG